MPATRQRLYINIDHVATVRQARRGSEPDPLEAARVCEAAGADGITAHLREDRRHIQDSDVRELRKVIKTYFNLELACAPEMLAIALATQPEQVTLVPERREEVTTEGGLSLAHDPARIRAAVDVGWMTTFAAQIERHTINTMGLSFIIPGMYRYFDLPDLAGLIAPRSLMVQMGSRDALFPVAAIQAAFDRIEACYRKAGAPDRQRCRLFDVPHEFNASMQREAWEFLKQWI